MKTFIKGLLSVIPLIAAVAPVVLNAQTVNTSPLPYGETVIGEHLHVGASNEVWSGASMLYFNYRGAASTTHFWNLGGSTGKPIMTLVNNGYVGLGAISPVSKLHINSAIERETLRIYKEGNTSKYLSIFQGNGGAAIDPIGTGLLYLGYDQSTNVIIGNNGGSLGIGTSTPQKTLDVMTGLNNYVSFGHYMPAGNYSGIHFGYFEPGNTQYRKSALIFERVDNAARGKIHLLNNGGNDATSATLSDSKMTIDYAGNIGIGTTTPSAKLEVAGNLLTTQNIRAQQYITVDNNSGSYRVAMNGQTDGYVTGRDNTGQDKFLITSNGNSFLNGGNLGIGTTNPDAKLAVKGTIHANEVKIDLLGAIAPDYVFEKDYKLPSLEQIKSYIDQNKHLPEVPSAKEMEANGINLGEMNMLLLKKVEELTLYVIEQQKQMEKMRKEISLLKKTIE